MQVIKALLHTKERQDPRGWKIFQQQVNTLRLQRTRVQKELEEVQGALFSATQQLEAEIDDEAGEHLKQSDFSHLVVGVSVLAWLENCLSACICVAGYSLGIRLRAVHLPLACLKFHDPPVNNQMAVAWEQITYRHQLYGAQTLSAGPPPTPDVQP